MSGSKNKVILVVAVVVMFNFGAFLVGQIIIDRVTDRVIQKLKKEYSPSPYGPGLDPDKISSVEPLKTSLNISDLKKEGFTFPKDEVPDWKKEWENSRGANGQ